ncbi:MAG: hypothetical protein SGBAC_012351 [Bacillariaceae sp.]
MITPAILICLAALSVVEGFQTLGRYQPASGFRRSVTPSRRTAPLLSSIGNADESSSENNNKNNGEDRIDVSADDRLYRIRLPRAPGIEWGTDLSFSFAYIRDLDPTGPACMSGQVSKGDQLCELIPVDPEGEAKPVNLLGASFDNVMGTFAGLTNAVTHVDLVFFKGTKVELKEACTGKDESGGTRNDITVTVVQNKGTNDEKHVKLQAKAGVNLRQLLVDKKLNVHQSVTRFTNCEGKQLCGTCIVNIPKGLENTNWKSMDEASTLRDNPDSYRLSCISFAYGDVTVETFPPIEKYQWTR